MKTFYAHSKDGCSENSWQTLQVHLKNTAQLSEFFAARFDAADLAYVMGFFHDLGKFSDVFQKRFYGGRRVNHSTAGARELVNSGNLLFRLLAYGVLGHHCGLADTGNVNDFGSFNARIKEDNIPDYSIFSEVLKEELKNIFQKEYNFPEKMKNSDNPSFSLSFLVRMLYSCLVDADSLDTEEFINGKNSFRENSISMSVLYDKFFHYISGLSYEKSEINSERQKIFDECIKCGKNSLNGIFQLTVPTGGGKTFSSMGFALEHAMKNNQDGVIYAIPFTSIIEQNAQVFRNIFGNKLVLEHHSNYCFDSSDDEDENLKVKFASQNWDIPVVVTTNVQFFESLFSNKRSKCRKLHNIANKVIILDEAQMLPIKYFTPCIRALEELVSVYNCSIVLCSATQPALKDKFSLPVREIIPDSKSLFNKFKRVDISQIGKISDEKLVENLLTHRQVLCIVNTKKHARHIYELMKEKVDCGNIFHLSTFMCPAHRKIVLKNIRDCLGRNQDVFVVSTQLIEAGVDISFPYVYRSSAGIDSIAQSAGRCNRHGELKKGFVRVFSSTEEFARPQGFLSRCSVTGHLMLEKFEDVLCPEAIEEYFKSLYNLESGFDEEKIMDCFSFSHRTGLEIFNYKTASEKFKFIDENTQSVVIPFDEKAKKLLEEIEYSQYPSKVLKDLQTYTVNLFDREYCSLLSKGAIQKVSDMVSVLGSMNNYDMNTGIIVEKEAEALFV